MHHDLQWAEEQGIAVMVGTPASAKLQPTTRKVETLKGDLNDGCQDSASLIAPCAEYLCQMYVHKRL